MLRASLVLVVCACALGCAGPSGVAGRDDSAASLKARGISAQQAQAAITAGKSTKPDVAAALGHAIEIKFDSGYEVWAYRWQGSQRTTRGDTELVILFDTSGRVKKTRIRPAYAE